MPHQRARGRHVQRVLDALVQLARIEALEVGALPSIDVEDLDIVARLDEIAFGRRRFHPQIQDRVGQRIGQVVLPHHPGLRPLQQDRHRGRRILRLRCHRQAGGGHHQPALVQRRQLCPSARWRLRREQPQRPRLAKVDLAALQPLAQPLQAVVALRQHRLQPLSARVRHLSQQHRVDPAVFRRRNQLHRLPALVVDERHPVAHHQLQQKRASPWHHMAFLPVMTGKAQRSEDSAWPRRPGNHSGIDRIEHGASRHLIGRTAPRSLTRIKLVHPEE